VECESEYNTPVLPVKTKQNKKKIRWNLLDSTDSTGFKRSE